jgi:hypothetical protein
MKKKLAIYLFVPSVMSLALIGAYFSGVHWLQQIVCPRFDKVLYVNSAREFGLLENLQNVFLIAITVIAGLGVRRKKRTIEKAALILLALFTIFVFLEEIDYGLHYVELAKGVKPLEQAEVRNVHNRGDINKFMKKGSNIGLALFFVVMPLAFAKSRVPLLRYLAADRYAILTMVAMMLLSALAHALQDRGFGAGGSIGKNISEFRELGIYYLSMVYCFDVVFRRSYGTPLPTGGAAQAEETSPA